MIDWLSVGFSALWILGLSLEVAVLSFAYYLTAQQDLRLSQMLEAPTFRTLIGLGLVFFCFGMAGIVTIMWERGVWAVLTLMFIWWILKVRIASRKP